MASMDNYTIVTDPTVRLDLLCTHRLC